MRRWSAWLACFPPTRIEFRLRSVSVRPRSVSGFNAPVCFLLLFSCALAPGSSVPLPLLWRPRKGLVTRGLTVNSTVISAFPKVVCLGVLLTRSIQPQSSQDRNHGIKDVIYQAGEWRCSIISCRFACLCVCGRPAVRFRQCASRKRSSPKCRVAAVSPLCSRASTLRVEATRKDVLIGASRRHRLFSHSASSIPSRFVSEKGRRLPSGLNSCCIATRC